MASIVRLPGLGMQQDRATLVAWHADPGDDVTEGELLAEIETEKATFEIEATESGVLRRIYADVGDVRRPNDPLGIIADLDEDLSALESEVDATTVDDDTPATTADGAEADSVADSGVRSNGVGATTQRTTATTDRKISPRARRRAEELSVDLETVKGTDGAVTADDVERAAGDEVSGAAEPERVSPRARKRADELGVELASLKGTGPGGAITEDDVEAAAGERDDLPRIREERPFGEMRRTIARRLHESYAEAVHVTLDRTATADELLDAANAASQTLETDVSITDVLLVALSAALDEHPEFNATAEDETHYLYEEHNIGIAVDVDRGLVTPVLDDVGSKSLEEIATERRAVTERVLANEFTPDELEGGTFTVTNLGSYGVESFDPIINPPQVAILGVNAIEKRAKPATEGNETIRIRRCLPLSLSFDHRVVDGADAARFLGTLVDHVEDPWPLLPDTGSPPTETETLSNRSVSARTEGGLAGAVTAGSFEWSFDEPGDLGGSGTAPTPVDRFLGAFASCLAASIGYQASKREVDLSNVRVDAQGRPQRGPLESIELTVELDADADDEALERLVDLGERGCHVADVLRDDLPVEIRWMRL